MNQKKPKAARKVVLDRTGEGDKARYSGLKMSQIVDDDEMGNKLAEYNKKMKDGTALKPKLIEEEFLSSLQSKLCILDSETCSISNYHVKIVP